jgi:hypothetical protein
MDLSARHAVELWTLGGRCFGGVLLVECGSIGAGLELLRTAFARVPQGAFTLFYTPVLAEIADALGRDGKASEGLSIIDEALARSDSNEERWCVAALLRINGELILLEGTPRAATVAEENLFAVARMGTPAGRPVMGAASVYKPCTLAAGSRSDRRGTPPSAVGVRSLQRGF